MTGAESTACRSPVAGHQALGDALPKHVVKQTLENRRGKKLAGPAYGRVPRQLFVYFVAEKKQNVQPQGTVLDEPAVADQVFQLAHKQELEKDHRVERGLARVAVKTPGLVVEKGPIQHIGQPPVEVVRRNPFGEPKVGHFLIEVLLFALHLFSTKSAACSATRSATATTVYKM